MEIDMGLESELVFSVQALSLNNCITSGKSPIGPKCFSRCYFICFYLDVRQFS